MTVENRERRIPLWPAVLGFWTLLGLVESALAYVRTQGTPLQLGWGRALINNLPWWLLWAALSPPALALARRFPLTPRTWRTTALVQLGAAVAFAGTHILVEGAIYYATWSHHVFPSVQRQWKQFVTAYPPLELITYFGIAGTCYAIEFQRRFRETELRSTRLQLGLSEARLQALRSELNPHFLFNALNAVAGLVRRNENEGAVRMLARIGELLSATLDYEGRPEIPLRDELKLLERYLEIERVRFGDRLTIEVVQDPRASAALVPSLMLQPLVENAVRHGISSRPGKARIELEMRREGDSLALAVRDTGDGLDSAAAPKEGIGLSNTRARLRELYGPAASLVLENAPGGGACVRVSLPYREGADA